MKPRSFGQKVSKVGRKLVGSLVQELPKKQIVTYKDFRGGYNSAQGREEGGANSSPNTQDVFVNKTNRLQRLPGGGAVVPLAQPAFEMTVQEALNDTAELVFFGPPYILVLGVGVDPVAYDLSILPSPEPFRYTTFGETLIFTNGFGVYTREPEEEGATLVNGIPLGMSYGVFAARLMVGGATIDGEYQPMGIAWSSTSGDPKDFTGLGSGFELLIAAGVTGDAIVAVRMMNLDLIGIVCKNSIWVGRRTNDAFRPAAFEPRIIGSGGLTDRTVVTTPIGVTYLSETGVRAFDGNSSVLISEPINAELLPLDLGNLKYYKLTYDERRNWIFLHALDKTWIYDIERTRWYRSSLKAVDSVLFKEQASGLTWDQAEAMGLLWDDVNGVPWSEYARKQIGQDRMLFLEKLADAAQWFLEDAVSQTYAGVAQFPIWEFRHIEPEYQTQLVTIDKIIIHYTGGGDIRFYLPDNEGTMTPVFKQALDDPGQEPSGRPKLRTCSISFIHTGQGASAQIELINGNVEIAKLQLVIDVRSENPSKPSSGLQEYIDFWEPIP